MGGSEADTSVRNGASPRASRTVRAVAPAGALSGVQICVPRSDQSDHRILVCRAARNPDARAGGQGYLHHLASLPAGVFRTVRGNRAFSETAPNWPDRRASARLAAGCYWNLNREGIGFVNAAHFLAPAIPCR